MSGSLSLPQLPGMGGSQPQSDPMQALKVWSMFQQQHQNRMNGMYGMGAGSSDGGLYGSAGNTLMALMLSNPEMFKQAGAGIGNLLGGFGWDGMASGGGLNALSGQAAGNIAAGAAGL